MHEADLYPHVQATLESSWAKERQIEPLAVEVTTAQGRKATGGRWTRPGLVSVAVRTYRHLPGEYMEVVTFEVKPADAVTVTAVYEALAHLRSATHAYVIFHVPDDSAESVQQVIDEARRVGRAHGVGVITMGDPRDWDTWNELEEARRVEPDPEWLAAATTAHGPATACAHEPEDLQHYERGAHRGTVALLILRAWRCPWPPGPVT